MAFAYQGAGALDYFPCQYDGSRLQFRGPARSLERPFVAVLGASESYGKYVQRPYSDLLQDRLGLNVVNLACINAGVDVYLNEEPITRIAARAEVAVVQVIGAQNTSNRFYTVHPRRNDRFLGATPLLRSVYRNVDFTEFAFNRHMLGVLHASSAERFAMVAAELRQAWLSRMKLLIERLPTQRILLWMADQPPPRRGSVNLGLDPVLIDEAMISELRPQFSAYVEMTPSAEARAEGEEGRICAEMERLAARSLPGQQFHREVSERVAQEMQRIL